jgi:hypothetical protein
MAWPAAQAALSEEQVLVAAAVRLQSHHWPAAQSI